MSNPTGNPVEAWKSEFGRDYIQRNPQNAEVSRQAETVYQRILRKAELNTQTASVLEVGANVGNKLLGMRRLLGPLASLSAVEPNAQACDVLRKNTELKVKDVFQVDAAQIPAADASYDLVYTNGVLIHVAPDRLPHVMKEIVRVSRRYILCGEYFSRSPEEITYRGNTGMLWKRDFGGAYLDQYPALKCLDYGFIWEREFSEFDNLTWWLFEKV